MTEHILERKQFIARPRSEVFAFFADAFNLERITPGFLNFKILTPPPIDMQSGTLIDYRVRMWGLPMKWRTRIESFKPEVSFVDTQVKGPYKLWHHTHTFEDVDGGTHMVDRVRYIIPLGPLGSIARHLFIKRTLKRIFDHRADIIAQVFEGPAASET